MTKTENLRNACEAASQVFAKINQGKYIDLQSKLEYCIGSYDHDKNPVGLYEFGEVAVMELKAFKSQNPRKVNKKIIEDLEKSLKS
jgi:hypothetical protein